MLFNQAIEDHRPVVIDHFHDRIIKVGGIVATDAFGAKGLGQFHEIGQASDQRTSSARRAAIAATGGPCPDVRC